MLPIIDSCLRRISRSRPPAHCGSGDGDVPATEQRRDRREDHDRKDAQHYAAPGHPSLSVLIRHYRTAVERRADGRKRRKRQTRRCPCDAFCCISICGKNPTTATYAENTGFMVKQVLLGRERVVGGGGEQRCEVVGVRRACLCQGAAAYIYISHIVTHSHL